MLHRHAPSRASRDRNAEWTILRDDDESHSSNASTAPGAGNTLSKERHVPDSGGSAGPSGAITPPPTESVGQERNKRKRPPGISASTFLCRQVVKWLVQRSELDTFSSAQGALPAGHC